MSNSRRGIIKYIIAITVITCLAIPVTAYFSQLFHLLYSRQMHTVVDNVDDKQGNEQLESIQPIDFGSGIESVVLFGVDSRTSADPGRADSIIIATIDMDTRVIKLTSIMRDLYVQIPRIKSMGRINTAYSIGGPELAVRTLNTNFGLDLKYYAVIDFRSFQDLVDLLGGIDVEVKDYEVKEINHYIKEANIRQPQLIDGPGLLHLSGQQALSYARIRKAGNGDWERTERQKVVLERLTEKIKNINIIKLPELLTTLASYTHTNIPLSKVISLSVSAYRFDNPIMSIRIPVDRYYEDQIVNGADVIVPDINANALFLREFINNLNTNSGTRPKPVIPDYSTPIISPEDYYEG